MNCLYKGYVPTRDKKSIIAFKNATPDDLLSLEDAEKFDEYAGVLADDTVLIDLDDGSEAEILLKIVKAKELRCKVIATTRGMHFLFKNNGEFTSNRTHCRLAIGLTADIKGCGKNSYEVLKHGGKLRTILYDSGEYQEAPRWLIPIKAKVDLLNMVEGEGRNNALFSYILPLQQNNFTVDECRECIEIINEFVLKDPLSSMELKGILRDGAFQKPIFFNARGTFLFDVFAKHLQRSKNIVRINGKLYIYRDGFYQSGEDLIEREMVSEIPTLNQSKRKEVMSYLELIAPKITTIADAHLIAFKNGVLNLITGDVYDFSPEYVITNMIPFNYNAEAKSELLDKTMRKLSCDDPQAEKLLYQAVGYCFYRRNELRKSFILIGEKRNGKSTFLDMVCTLLGEDNISNLDLAEIGDKFKTAELTGKLANIGDDINDEHIPNSAVFKKVVSGDKVTVERKGQDPYVLASYAKCFFSANAMPRIGRGKDSAAIKDRLVTIPFDAKFSKEDADYDPFIKYKLRDEHVIEALIAKSVVALKELLEDQQFAICERSEKANEEYERVNNPILTFFETLNETDYLNESVTKVYIDYTTYCSVNNLKPMSSIEFGRQMKRQFNLEIKDTSVNKRRVRIFVRSDDD